MADTNKPARILSDRGRKIAYILNDADSNRDLIRCLAEAIAYLEDRIDKVDKSSTGNILDELMYDKQIEEFKYREDD